MSARPLTADHPALRAAIGAVTAGAVVAVAWRHRTAPTVGVLLSLAALSYGALSIIDAAEQRLPNRITLPLAGGTLVAVLAGGLVDGDLAGSVGAAGIGLAFALVFLVMGFGMGDVKLALTVGTIAGWFGRDAIVVTAVVGSLTGAAAALALMLIHRRRDLSFGFGPFLAIGSVAGMVAAGS